MSRMSRLLQYMLLFALAECMVAAVTGAVPGGARLRVLKTRSPPALFFRQLLDAKDALLLEKDAARKEKDAAWDALLREKDAARKEKDAAWDALLREKDAAWKEKDAAWDALLREKDAARDAAKEAHAALLEKEKELAKQQALLAQSELKHASEEVLRANSFLTGRGVLERCLYLADRTMAPNTKRFVAAEACRRIGQGRKPPANAVGKWEQVLIDSHARVQSDFPESSVAKRSVAAAYEDLYVLLSHDIHNYRWSGLKVRVLDKNLGPENVALITGVAEELGLEVECVSSPKDVL